MKILALELSSPRGSIAFGTGPEAPTLFEFPADRRHSGAFFEHLQLALARRGTPERIVVGLGPGSYAGTRIAIAAAVGLRAATGAELLGLSSACAMLTDADEYVMIGDARRGSFFLIFVNARRSVGEPLLCSGAELVERIAPLRCPLFATEPIAQVPQATIGYPSALILAELGRSNTSRFLREPLEPIYLRGPHITQPKAVTT